MNGVTPTPAPMQTKLLHFVICSIGLANGPINEILQSKMFITNIFDSKAFTLNLPWRH
jgi:hypothetical protein